MIKAVAFASAAIAVVTAAAYPGADRCRVGISFSGLGEGLGGDFVLDEDTYSSPSAQLFYTANGTGPYQKGGCYSHGCSAADTARADNKWAMFTKNDKLLAVCDSGCPHIFDDCSDVDPGPYWAGWYCGRWPGSWKSQPMTWTLVGGGKSKNVTFQAGNCCKPKVRTCDSCEEGHCAVLTTPFWNMCMPHPHGVLVTAWQKECCMPHMDRQGFNHCDCNFSKQSRFHPECDHSEEQEVEVESAAVVV